MNSGRCRSSFCMVTVVSNSQHTVPCISLRLIQRGTLNQLSITSVNLHNFQKSLVAGPITGLRCGRIIWTMHCLQPMVFIATIQRTRVINNWPLLLPKIHQFVRNPTPIFCTFQTGIKCWRATVDQIPVRGMYCGIRTLWSRCLMGGTGKQKGNKLNLYST